MLLFTSSSDQRIPRRTGVSNLLLCLALLLVLLAGMEWYWRYQEFLANVTDSEQLWSIWRERVYTQPGEPRKLVILGASRAQLGLVPEVLEAQLPGYQVIHLALNGVSPRLILLDLLNDADFNGVILCAITAEWLMPSDFDVQAREHLRFYHQDAHRGRNLAPRFNTLLKNWLQSKLVTLSAPLRLDQLLYTGMKPEPQYLYMRLDRYRPGYYNQRMTAEQREQHRQQRIDWVRAHVAEIQAIDPHTFISTLERELLPAWQKLLERGGKLLLLRMPTTDEHWAFDQQLYPKADYWDRIQPRLGMPTLHFLDDPDLASFPSPDTSHLDASDAPRFTQLLGEHLHAWLSLPAPSP